MKKIANPLLYKKRKGSVLFFVVNYLESLLRPLSLRRFNTFLPAVVAILLRKPCTLLVCLFLG